jgi:hypothetical protein
MRDSGAGQERLRWITSSYCVICAYHIIVRPGKHIVRCKAMVVRRANTGTVHCFSAGDTSCYSLLCRIRIFPAAGHVGQTTPEIEGCRPSRKPNFFLESIFGRTLLKFVPWEFSHTLIWAIYFSPGADSVWISYGFALVYLLIGLNILSLVITRKNQTLYDLLTHTYVITSH